MSNSNRLHRQPQTGRRPNVRRDRPASTRGRHSAPSARAATVPAWRAPARRRPTPTTSRHVRNAIRAAWAGRAPAAAPATSFTSASVGRSTRAGTTRSGRARTRAGTGVAPWVVAECVPAGCCAAERGGEGGRAFIDLPCAELTSSAHIDPIGSSSSSLSTVTRRDRRRRYYCRCGPILILIGFFLIVLWHMLVKERRKPLTR